MVKTAFVQQFLMNVNWHQTKCVLWSHLSS